MTTLFVLGDYPDHPRARGLSRLSIVLGDCPDHHHARGLSRPPSCSWTVQTTIVLGDCPDHHHSRGLSTPLLCSGTVPTTLMLGDCPDHSPNITQRLLSSATCDLYSHTVERRLFRPCYKATSLPSSKLGDYIGTMHLPVHLVWLIL